MVLSINELSVSKALGVLGLVIVTSCYIFPFEFKALPGFNTKMGIAALGLVCLFIELGKARDALINRQILNISVIALLVSLISLFSITLNNTSDISYARYIVSIWVWLGGAYATVFLIQKLHGGVSVILVGNYLIATCVMQCILAIMIDRIPFVFNIVNTYIGNFGVGGSAQGFAESGRLYGIGAAVDFAGIRFVPVLLIIAYVSVYLNTTTFRKYMTLYIVAFIVITFVGNMMSRTTTVGALMALAFWLYASASLRGRDGKGVIRLWKYLALLLAIVVPIIVVLYNTNDFVHEKVRFGFEGFFSLVESGHWQTNSNDILKNMYRFPTTFKTWIIGDGYFDNPTDDPYYVGYQWKGFYMGTDVGYLRFIFYFGLIGLAAIVGFMAKVTTICMDRFEQYKKLFLLLLLATFVIWFKVSTDLFPVLALFLMVKPEEDAAYMKRIAL